MHGDSGCTGPDKRKEVKTAQAEGRLCKDIAWHNEIKRGQWKAMPEGPAKALYGWFERRKVQIRAILENPFHVIKNLFGYRKVSTAASARTRHRTSPEGDCWPKGASAA